MRRGDDRRASATLRASGGACSDAERGEPWTRPQRASGDLAGYERWLARQTERLDPVMALLGILFALIVAFQLAQPGLSSGWARAFDVATWVIWAVFVVEYVARLVAAPSARAFLRRHWLAALMLLVPTLRLLRFAALLRIGRALPAARVVSSSYRATGVARQLARSRAAFLGAVAAVVTLAVAELGWLAERDEGTFASFGDALLWSATAVVALQADPSPATVAGRLVALAAFLTGLVLVAALAGTVGAYLLEERRERSAAEGE